MTPRKAGRAALKLSLAMGIGIAATGCGLQMGLPTPVPTSSNAPPAGSSLVGSGSLVPENAASVSGNVSVYDEQNGTYVVQIANLSASFPTTPVSVQVRVNNLRVTAGALSSTTGTSSYTFSAPAGATVQELFLTCTTCSPVSTDYAYASL